MSKTPDTSFTKDAMATELREILVAQAGHIAYVAGDKVAAEFLGFQCDLDWANEPSREVADKINLQRFQIWRPLDAAFDYAFQVGNYDVFGTDISFRDDIAFFSNTVTKLSIWGTEIPYNHSNSKVRHVIDLAIARAIVSGHNEHGDDLSVRQLALLANMSEAAVRNSLSAEKISAPVHAEDALAWLKGRKGFIPTKGVDDRDGAGHKLEKFENPLRFELGFILPARGLTPETAAAEAQMSLEEIRSLSGEAAPVLISVDKLQRLGAVLKVDVPSFVGKATEAILRRLG